jgi:hypothetical protein
MDKSYNTQSIVFWFRDFMGLIGKTAMPYLFTVVTISS